MSNNIIHAEFEQITKICKQDGNGGEAAFASAILPHNVWKNRYNNVLPNETTRVKLSTAGGESDYINANYVDGGQYIVCQAPLLSTAGDFWRMVWDEHSYVVVCLTRLNEQGRSKADLYWPIADQPVRFGSVTLWLHKRVIYKDITVHSLVVCKDGESEAREVIHLHYTEWPDFGTPVTTNHMRTLAQLLTKFKKRGATRGLAGPAVIHCSAGIGRAGTFTAIHIILTKLQKLLASQPFTPASVADIPWLSIKDVVLRLRSQRCGMVQTAEQYELIYRVINDSLRDLQAAVSILKPNESPVSPTSPTSPIFCPVPPPQPPSSPPSSPTLIPLPSPPPAVPRLSLQSVNSCQPSSPKLSPGSSPLRVSSPRSPLSQTQEVRPMDITPRGLRSSSFGEDDNSRRGIYLDILSGRTVSKCASPVNGDGYQELASPHSNAGEIL